MIPGSHHRGDAYAQRLHETMPSSRMSQVEDHLGLAGQSVTSVTLESRPGDMVMFNQDVKHSSFGGGTRRRMFTINFSERYGDEDLPMLRDDISGLVRFWAEHAYGDAMIDTATARRMRHLEQQLANDGHLQSW